MVIPEQCEYPKANTQKTWLYDQYYTGDKDKQQRKNGQGQNHWSGAKSLECYSGNLVRDTMHGEGAYQWRYLGPEGAFVTYEGHVFNNQMHGYGAISYGDGKVFNGIFYNNVRWGPGIEYHACVKADVGLWNGRQLIRLCWRPNAPSITPELMSSNIGKEIVKPHRMILSSSIKAIGEVNSALEMIKHYGGNPLTAVNQWSKLYPDHCTDMSSALCHTEMFENEYYNGKIFSLKENIEKKDESKFDISEDATQEIGNFYSWNNNVEIKHMMKHCYKHEFQRRSSDLDLAVILSGPRKQFKPAGQHEIDCRTLLMASYLGHISYVTQLVNEKGISPNIADIQGNSALMYATCGERIDVIHFLVEAGADVNSCNDSCCTPLGVVLINLACAQKDIAPNEILQSLLPQNFAFGTSSTEMIVSDWLKYNSSQSPSVGGTLTKSPSKIKNFSAKKIKSVVSLKDTSGKKKMEALPVKVLEQDSDESFSEDKRVYSNINREYAIRVDNVYQATSTSPVTYMFEINDMVKAVDDSEEEPKKGADKTPKKVLSKVLREATKPSKDAMWQSDKEECRSIDSTEKQKRDKVARITSTMFQLLSDGADPKLVTCPQPALFIAIVSGSSEAVRHLICYGADVNEVYPTVLGYSPLDIAISQPFTYENLEIIRALLEYGADTKHRLVYDVANELASEIPGPSLLHALLARTIESEDEEEIRREIIEILLDYNCNPTMDFKGRSAIDMSMTKNLDVFDIFIRHPNTNLNAVINDFNQSVLVKMFYVPFFKTIVGPETLQRITDLLLFGANPLIKCQNGDVTYENIFVFAKKSLIELEGNYSKAPTVAGTGKQDSKGKKLEKPKKDEKSSTKSMGRMMDDVGEYTQALELVTECARLLHIRWLQATIVKELVVIIKKYSHRHWNMILKDIKYKKNIGLWLTPQRCVEIWNVLAKKHFYRERHILKHLLNIVQFCANRTINSIALKKPLTSLEKGIIEKTVNKIHDGKYSESFESEVMWKRCYVKPELISKQTKIFDVCFECSLPLTEEKIICTNCKLVSFCSFECMKINIDRVNCHPCSYILKDKYFPTISDSTYFTRLVKSREVILFSI